MKYLIRNTKKSKVYHLWNGSDTVCKLWSTGGMNQSRYIQSDDNCGLALCQMCNNNNRKTIDIPERKYGTLMSGGMCPCGGGLSYSSWTTITELKERLYCRSCGRSEYASKLKPNGEMK